MASLGLKKKDIYGWLSGDGLHARESLVPDAGVSIVEIIRLHAGNGFNQVGVLITSGRESPEAENLGFSF